MFRKIKLWWLNRSQKFPSISVEEKRYTYDEVVKIAEDWGHLRFDDGRRAGLAVAREQAQNSLREILKSQNQSK